MVYDFDKRIANILGQRRAQPTRVQPRRVQPRRAQPTRVQPRIRTMVKPMNRRLDLSHWKHTNARNKVYQLAKFYGPPTYVSGNRVEWTNIKPYTRVWVLDESVPHNFPVNHYDFLYSSIKLRIPPRYLDDLGRVTGSILYDGLKGETTARCSGMVKNAVTLGFVADVVAGKIKATKAEYAKRIINDLAPSWHKTGRRL